MSTMKNPLLGQHETVLTVAAVTVAADGTVSVGSPTSIKGRTKSYDIRGEVETARIRGYNSTKIHTVALAYGEGLEVSEIMSKSGSRSVLETLVLGGATHLQVVQSMSADQTYTGVIMEYGRTVSEDGGENIFRVSLGPVDIS